MGHTTADDLQGFQAHKADIYDALQHRLLSTVPSKIAKAPLMAVVTSAAILEDKARLVRGQATGINVSVLLDVAEAIRQRRRNPQVIDSTSTKDDV